MRCIAGFQVLLFQLAKKGGNLLRQRVKVVPYHAGNAQTQNGITGRGTAFLTFLRFVSFRSFAPKLLQISNKARWRAPGDYRSPPQTLAIGLSEIVRKSLLREKRMNREVFFDNYLRRVRR